MKTLSDKRKDVNVWNDGYDYDCDIQYEFEEEEKGDWINVDDVKDFIKGETEQIIELMIFLQSDLWFSVREEMKGEKDLQKYIADHFYILLKNRDKLIGKSLLEDG